jgi:hypothetical protein
MTLAGSRRAEEVGYLVAVDKIELSEGENVCARAQKRDRLSALRFLPENFGPSTRVQWS